MSEQNTTDTIIHYIIPSAGLLAVIVGMMSAFESAADGEMHLSHLMAICFFWTGVTHAVMLPPLILWVWLRG